ncbi:hypothetical protein ACJX0J_038396, partial [Zea mays]
FVLLRRSLFSVLPFKTLLLLPLMVLVLLLGRYLKLYIFLYFQRCIGVLEASAYPTVYHIIVLIKGISL